VGKKCRVRFLSYHAKGYSASKTTFFVFLLFDCSHTRTLIFFELQSSQTFGKQTLDST
jgi:hypothetical protein